MFSSIIVSLVLVLGIGLGIGLGFLLIVLLCGVLDLSIEYEEIPDRNADRCNRLAEQEKRIEEIEMKAGLSPVKKAKGQKIKITRTL